MKSIIIYASTHHGNTKKVAEAIAKECGVELLDATVVKEKDLSEYDLIGFASGIYAAKFHKAVMDFAARNLPANKKIFYIMTSAMNQDFSGSMKSAVQDKKAQALGVYTCRGYNTFGPFKLVGGTGKGHPDATDLTKAVEFYKEITAKM